MQDSDVRTVNCQHLDVADHRCSSLKLQEVLSLRLPYFHRCALRVLGNSADAEDAVQEAVLAAYRHINQFRGQSQISTWLTTIVRNCALMQLRRRPRHIHVPLDAMEENQQYFVWERLADGRPTPEDECRHSELAHHLRGCAALLSPPLLKTFQLRVVDGLSISETSRLLGLPHGTIKAQLARARAKIARHMRPALAARSHTRRAPAQIARPARKTEPVERKAD